MRTRQGETICLGQFHSPRKIVCPAESKLVFRIFVKKSSNINQKKPPKISYVIILNMHNSLLNEFVSNTEKYSSNLVTNSEEKLLLRPLIPSDVKLLTSFLEGLSVETRRLSTFDSYDSSMAKELCDAINKYDKLRFVLINSLGSILGLIEFTLDIPESDIERFLSYGINLDVSKTCRF